MSSERMSPFRNRWFIEGVLRTTSPLHLGDGGETPWPNRPTAPGEPVVRIRTLTRDAKEKPCIPGSSLKGVLRSALRATLRTGGIESGEFERMFGSPDPAAPDSCGGAVEFHDARVPDGFVAPSFHHAPPWWDATRLSAIDGGVALNPKTRTADEHKLFHCEYVPAGVEFNVSITAQNLEETDVSLLLQALEAFNPREDVELADPLALGAGSQGGKGRMQWHLTAVRRLNPGPEVMAWLKDPQRSAGGSSAAQALPEEEIKRLQELKPVAVTAGSGERLVLRLKLRFTEPFLVNDPAHTLKEGAREDTPDHYPRLDAEGRPMVPESSFRGVFRAQAQRILRTLASDPEQVAAPGELTQPSRDRSSALAPADFAALSLADRIFGATGWQTPIYVSDFVASSPADTRRQEFVAIDRFMGGSAKSMKFNAEAVAGVKPPGEAKEDQAPLPAELHGVIIVRMKAWEKAGVASPAAGLLALTLRDLLEGDVTFGFGAAKGYGACTAEFADEASRQWFQQARPGVAALRAQLTT